MRRSLPVGSAAAARTPARAFAVAMTEGPTSAASVRPASVRFTLRVVRRSRATPTSSSRRDTAWLTAEVDTPSRFAAREKLCSSATAKNTGSWASVPPRIISFRLTLASALTSFTNQS